MFYLSLLLVGFVLGGTGAFHLRMIVEPHGGGKVRRAGSAIVLNQIIGALLGGFGRRLVVHYRSFPFKLSLDFQTYGGSVPQT